jgi:hypothetical protein
MSKRSILIVEDDTVAATGLAETLGMLGTRYPAPCRLERRHCCRWKKKPPKLC